MTKDEEILSKRFKELSNASLKKMIITNTDFLNLNELNIFEYTKSELSNSNYEIVGGYETCERKMIRFFPEYDLIDKGPPIVCLKISPSNMKFSDELNHRDFLGAILNLGIERSKIGDILIEENVGYVFCHSNISEYIINNLEKVKHTNIKLSKINDFDVNYTPKFKLITGTVSSIRLDSVIALAFQTSRSKVTGLIEGGKVFVNSKLTINNSYFLKEKDIISVRGHGKFTYESTMKQTKKGRYYISLHKFI